MASGQKPGRAETGPRPRGVGSRTRASETTFLLLGLGPCEGAEDRQKTEERERERAGQRERELSEAPSWRHALGGFASN